MEWTRSRSQREDLRRLMQTTNDARECRRCRALLELDGGRAVRNVACEYGVSRQTLYNWDRRFREKSSLGLQDRSRSGRPTHWNHERTRTLERLLADSPRQHGFHIAGWTVGLLQTRLQQLLDWTVSESSLRQQLHALDYVWKRFRYVLKPDPEREKKKTYPQARQTFARQGCRFVSGRNGPDVVSPVAIGMDAQRASRPGRDLRRKCETSRVWDGESHGTSSVAGSSPSAGG